MKRMHDDSKIKAIVNENVSGTYSGSNWTKLKLNGVEKNIPAGGGGELPTPVEYNKNCVAVIYQFDEDSQKHMYANYAVNNSGIVDSEAEIPTNYAVYSELYEGNYDEHINELVSEHVYENFPVYFEDTVPLFMHNIVIDFSYTEGGQTKNAYGQISFTTNDDAEWSEADLATRLTQDLDFCFIYFPTTGTSTETRVNTAYLYTTDWRSISCSDDGGFDTSDVSITDSVYMVKNTA